MTWTSSTTGWALLFGSATSLTVAAIIIALLFRYRFIALIAAHSVVSSLIILCRCGEALTGNSTPANIWLFNTLNLVLFSVFTAIIANLLIAYYQSKRFKWYWLSIPYAMALIALLVSPLDQSTSFYLVISAITCIILGLSVVTISQLSTGYTATMLSAAKLILVVAIGYLNTKINDSQAASTDYLLGVSVFYWLDLVVISSMCWLAFYRINTERLQRNIASARQEIKIASLAPLIKASRHELRAPLADILGLAELIDDGPLDQWQRKSLLDIKHSAHQGLAEINQLFTYDTDNKDGEYPAAANTPFDITELIKDCVQYYSYYIDEHHKEVITKLADLEGKILSGQQEKIRQLLMHLLEHFLIDTEIEELVIDANINTPEQLCIRIEYSQPGTEKNAIGIENSPSIVTAHSLTEQLLGSIQFNAGKQQVKLMLPVEISKDQPSEESSIDILKGKRILVLDDNPKSCEVIAAYLQKLGVISYSCTNGTEATAMLHHQQDIGETIDLIIVDFRMPVMSGAEFIQSVIADPVLRHPPACIMMSNTTQLALSKSIQSLGVEFILEKPVMPNTLKFALLNEFSSSVVLQTTPPKKALIVEDNEISARITTAILKQNDIPSDHASNAHHAKELIADNIYELIFIDLNLPDSDGIALSQQIDRHYAHHAHSAVYVALTAENSPAKIQQSIAAGFDTFITKPLSQQRVNEILNRFF